MENTFWDSNLFQTLVLIITIGTTVGIALWQFLFLKGENYKMQ